jgi:hypothetical protein
MKTYGVLEAQLHTTLTSAPDGAEWQLQVPAALRPLYRRLGGPQSRSGHGVEENNSQLPPGIEPRSSDRPAR